ncbi:MAG: flagellar basal body-associated FliL family protein [Methylophaga sp.]
MAEKQDDIQVVEENNSKTIKLLLFIIAALLLAVIGLGAYMLTKGDKQQTVEQSETGSQSPVYYTIQEPFIVNFSEQSNGQVQYLQVKMEVMARSQAVIEQTKIHLPAIQHELLMLFYSQKYDGLLTSEGIQALQQACLQTINRILRSETPMEGELEAVYFSSFIMQ